GGNQVQNGLFTVDHQGVASVVAPLITHDCSSLLGEQVDDLALALITPLGAQDDDILTHDTCPLRAASMPAAGRRKNSFRTPGAPPANVHHATSAGGHSLPRAHPPRSARAAPVPHAHPHYA